MKSDFLQKPTSRREILRDSAKLAGSAFLAHLFPAALLRASAASYAQQSPAADPVATIRAQMGAAPIEAQKLADNLTLLSGPGGNVVVLNGPDGKFIVDTFLSPAWPKFKDTLDGIGNAPLKFVLNTHWHFDHTDNNAHLHAAEATVLAHENTKKRMSIHFQKANVIHMGDTFFNGFYPYIDSSTGGKISGMIAAADKVLPLAGNYTKIVPGHGPLGNKAGLAKFRDMLVTARDRIQKLKSAGKSAQEAVAEKPFADLDPIWGKGRLNADQFVQVVYLAL